MIDVGIGFLLDKLKQLADENAKLIAHVKDDVEGLEKDLQMLKAFLEDAVEQARRTNVVRQLVSEIRQLTYDIEDVIDAFIVEAAGPGRNIKRWLKRGLGVNHALKLRNVALKAQKVRTAMQELPNNPTYSLALLGNYNHGGQTTTEKKPPVVEEDNVVGFDKPTEELIDLLNAKTGDLQVISIVGMPGLGKTTLANKVYNDPRVVEPFSARAWIYVSQKYTKKDLLVSILKSGNQLTNTTDEKNLVQEVRAYLTRKYLIVLDDVWDKEDWNDIKEAFPNNKNGSRILLTSRIESVGKHANPLKHPYQFDFLKEDQSWELLRFKAFGQRECPPDREDLIPLGRSIALECHGLPLALVVIGGLLETKNRKDQWENVATRVDAFLVEDEKQQCLKMLNLSYDHLPPHLKPCFLYFGVFPKGYNIPVWILIRLWIAEGFVRRIGDLSFEKMAEDYLDELAARNLVLVVKRSLTGRIKTCRVHDVLREMCLEKAKEEYFLFEIKETGESTHPFGAKHRRLCIHSGVVKYISSKPCGLRVRSFLSFSKDQVNLSKDFVGCIPEVFKMLRVYNIQPITFPRFPTEILKLVHLTHVAFSGEFTIIPRDMSKLSNLQTLIAETSSRNTCTIDIQANIFKMSQFRHLHTNKASQLVAKSSDNTSNESVQTLTPIIPESCTEDVLGQTPYIKKLGIHGRLTTLFKGNGWSLFDNLTHLQKLVTLKLFNDAFSSTPEEHKPLKLPHWNCFPPNLKKLTLSNTFLDWNQMYALGKLPNLEELKLKDNAFKGVRWILRNGGFKQLIALQIWNTNLEKWEWEAGADHFPRLEYVFLNECVELGELPPGLGDVQTLRTIKLHRTSPRAAVSARKIKSKQQESNMYHGLKVEIFPPDLGQGSSPDDH